MVTAGKMLQSQEEVALLPEAGEEEKKFHNKVLSVNEELRRGYKNINHLQVHHLDHQARIKRAVWDGIEGKEALTVG
jgi:hypothetical protein